MRRRIVLAGLVTLVVSGSAACGGGGGSSGATKAPAAKSGVNAIAATARGSVKQGGQFVWPVTEIAPNFNFNELDGTNADGARVINALMPRLFIIDAAGSPHWNKDYLASEPVLKTDPKQVVTFDFNPKANWYDGTPITWEDLFSQWKANNGENPAYKISSSNGWKSIESIVKGKDDRQAVVTFKDKYADWQPLFNVFYPKSTNADPAVFNEGWIDKIPTTAGPFKFSALDKTAQTITLVPNEKWWGNKPKLDKIIFKVVDDTAQADALANGEIDFMDIGANVNSYKRAKTLTDKIDLRRAGGPNFRHITINAARPQLSDKSVRQALAMAINRQTLGKALLQPLDIEPQVLNNHIFMTNHGAYKDNAGAVGRFDPAKAKSMLDAAGWKLDGDIRKKDGAPLAINFVIPANVQASKQESELIQSMLKDVGVTVTIKAVPLADFFDKYITPGDYDFTVFSWLGTAFPVSSTESVYKKPVPDDKGQLQIEQNYARVGSDEIDKLFAQATAELDKTKQNEIGNKIDAALWNEVGVLPMYQRPDLAAVRKDVVNFGAFAYASVIYEDIGYKQ
ncbi:MAG: glutathione transport system substrate-binding protein [Micromonosporaceae bacterium]|nr:glutathione transport system substrate-binding protein [Micromonosporaceae bacterium]